MTIKIMDRKTIEEIFKLGSEALYKTLNPDNGNVDDRYFELKEEAVKLFSIQTVMSSDLKPNQRIVDKDYLKSLEKFFDSYAQ